MKRKIKKHLFHVNEVKQYEKLLNSSDQECVNLGKAMFLNSKTYKHYICSRIPPTLVDFLTLHSTYQLVKLIEDYSHLKYKR